MSRVRRTSILRPTLALAAAAFAIAPCAGAGAPTDPAAQASGTELDASAKGGGFTVRRHVVAGGGGSSSGGAFAIAGTVGQADADPLHPASGGVFAIRAGFWPMVAAAAPPGDALFSNGFEPAAR